MEWDIIDHNFVQKNEVVEAEKKKLSSKELYDMFYKWLFDNKKTTICPSEVTHYSSPISHSFVISMFTNYPKIHAIMNKYLNTLDSYRVPKQDLFKFVKQLVQIHNVKQKNLMWFSNWKKSDPYVKKIKERAPYMSTSDIELIEYKIQNDQKFKSMLDETLGFTTIKKQKVSKEEKVTGRQVATFVSMQDVKNQLESSIKNKETCKSCLLKDEGYTLFDCNFESFEFGQSIDILFIGRDPGENEVKQKKPFVGRAGNILREYIREFDIDANTYMIYNIVQCRPPENKSPHESVINNCRHFLETMINFTNPKLIVALGGVTAEWFGITGPVKENRGKLFDWKGRKVFVTYHPSAFLHSKIGG